MDEKEKVRLETKLASRNKASEFFRELDALMEKHGLYNTEDPLGPAVCSVTKAGNFAKVFIDWQFDPVNRERAREREIPSYRSVRSEYGTPRESRE